ncbi:MAG: sigma 54-interacting transcriptional regulator [Treponemataceae bacterium]
MSPEAVPICYTDDDSVMIVVIAPYEKLKATADSLLDRYDIPIRTVVGDLGVALFPARAAAAEGSIIVSRGGTAKLIRETLGVDVIEIGVSQFELLRVLKPFIGGSRRVAVVGFRSLTDHAEDLCRILDIPAVCLPIDYEAEIGERMRSLAGMDIDCLIGDMVSIRSAESVHAELHLIESGADAIKEALDKAAVVARSVRQRRESDLRIRAVFNAVQDGIVSVDKDGLVDQLNPKAGELLGSENPRGRSIDSVIPNFDFKHIMSEGRDSFGKIAEIHGHRTVVNVTPIMMQGRAEGAVAVIQEVGKIQDLEKRVRKQLFAKGLFTKYRFDDILIDSPVMKRCVEVAKQYARASGSIVIFGETGTGKELLAQSIHNESAVHDGPFVAINCGALPPTLLESELFGYVEGAFTGAVKGGKAGLFELAHEGTIFLDEINELDFQLQTKLLRVLQEREVMRVGDTKVIPVSVRVLAASNVPLREEVAKGRMRKDLFYRLNVLDIRIPPLRERPDDIITLFDQFAKNCAERNGDPAPSRLTTAFSERLRSYQWPGNVRELENAAEKYVVLRRLMADEDASVLVTESLGDAESTGVEPAGAGYAGTLEEIERRAARAVFSEEGGNVTRAAKRLGVDRQTLRKKLGP